jgi:MFS family permease
LHDGTEPASGAGGDSLEAQERAYQTFIWDNLKRNYTGHFMLGMLGLTGWRLFGAPTILPAYLHQVSGSNVIVGLGLALQQIGAVLTPIISANMVEHKRRILPTAMWTGGCARLPILAVALAGLFLTGDLLTTALLVVLLFYGVFMGVQRVVFNVLLAKMIPITRRGRLQAWRNATGGLIAALLAYAAGKYLIGPDLFGHGYSLTFLAAFLATSAGMSLFAMTIREPIPPTAAPKSRLHERLADFPRLLAADKRFGAFLLVLMLATASRIAMPFYIIFAGQSLHLTGTVIGLMSLAFLGADTLSNLFWGYTGDRTGFRRVLVLSLAIWIGSTVLLLFSHTIPATAAAFFGLGAAGAGYQMSAQTMVLEYGSREDVPMRLGLATSAECLVAAISPLVGGVVADRLGFPVVFGASIAFLTLAILLTPIMGEPRRKLPEI